MNKVKLHGNTLTLKFTTYEYENWLCAYLVDTFDTPYATISKVLVGEESTNENCIFLDVNNCGMELIEALADYGQLTGYSCKSGFCVYPEFEFDINVIGTNIDPEEVLYGRLDI